MAKVKLGARPKTFKLPVSFKMLTGEDAVIECEFKYRTRTEFGAFIDRIMSAANIVSPADGNYSMKVLMEKTRGSNADYLLEVLESWGLEEPLSRANAEALADEVPGAVNAIMETYRAAINEGRVKN